MRAKIINPTKRKSDGSYQVCFRHPLHGNNQRTRSLGTHDETIAQHICNDLAKLCMAGDLGQDPHNPRLLAYDPRAVAIFFSIEASESLESQRVKPSLDVSEIATVAQRLCSYLGLAKNSPNFDVIHKVLAEYESNRWKEMNARCEQLETIIKVLKPENESLKSELGKWAQERNAHVKVSIGQAYAKFKLYYPSGRKRQTIAETYRCVDSFIASLPEKEHTKLAIVKSQHVDNWVQSLKGVDGETLAPQTIHHRKTYVSSFFTWAERQYKLSEHPVQKAAPVSGASRPPENIEALTLEQIHTLIKGLKPHPYWQTWVATAILAGLRWGEQVALPLEAVNLADNYITIRASKTGRQRRVPIEQTTLLPILKRYVQSCEGKGQRLLFPNIAPPHPYMERKVSVADVWSSARVWHNHFDAAKPTGASGDQWNFGPREWRHTFGTALGQSGMSGVEIARLMGNSPTIADRHYIAVSDAGKRWSFKW